MDAIVEQTRITQWGNSRAIRIPNRIIKQLGLKENELLTVSIKDNVIVLTPEKKEPKDIHELFAGWQDDGQREHELDWSKAEGRKIEW